MNTAVSLPFDHPGLAATLAQSSDADFDACEYGVIGFDAEGVVRAYNTFESNCAGLSAGRVKGHSLFNVVAPCMNNFLVAQRFEDATAAATALDATIDYVLTLRMRPVKVKLRLLAQPGAALRFVLVQRRA